MNTYSVDTSAQANSNWLSMHGQTTRILTFRRANARESAAGEFCVTGFVTKAILYSVQDVYSNRAGRLADMESYTSLIAYCRRW